MENMTSCYNNIIWLDFCVVTKLDRIHIFNIILMYRDSFSFGDFTLKNRSVSVLQPDKN